MILNLTDLSNESLQSQIYRQIRAMILADDVQSGDMLPSIRKLARDEKISVITVQRGYEQLEKENLILSRRGKGFFVSELNQSKKKELAERGENGTYKFYISENEWVEQLNQFEA